MLDHASECFFVSYKIIFNACKWKKNDQKISFEKWSEMARKLAKSLVLLLYLIFDSLQCCKVLFFLAVSPPKDQHTPSVAVIETLYSHWHLMGTDTQISINKYLQTKWKDASGWTSATFSFSLHPICLLSLLVRTNSEICLWIAPVLRIFLFRFLGFMLLTLITFWPPFLYL